MYYLQSRYYDPEIGRFVNGDSYASTGNGIIGFNMFAYCCNNPVNCRDSRGTSSEALQWWTSTMWLLFAIDGPSIIGDAIFTIGAIVLGGSILDSLFNSTTTTTASPSASIDPKEHENALSQAKSYARSISGPNEQYVVHHIVAKKAPLAEPARNVLRSVGIDPYSNGLNLAIIPQSKHVSLHTTNYYQYVNRRLEGLNGNMDAVVATLVELQSEIQIYCHTGLKAW